MSKKGTMKGHTIKGGHKRPTKKGMHDQERCR